MILRRRICSSYLRAPNMLLPQHLPDVIWFPPVSRTNSIYKISVGNSLERNYLHDDFVTPSTANYIETLQSDSFSKFT